MSVATSEPTQITAGFSSEWDISLGDYPASLYSLTYTLAPIGGGKPKQIASSASGDTFQIRLTPTDTEKFNAGTYQLTGYVSETGEDFKAQTHVSRLEVMEGANSEADRRTYAERIYSELKKAYEGLAGQTITSASVAGKQFTQKDLIDIRKEMNYWKDQIQNETGIGATKKIKVHFNPVS